MQSCFRVPFETNYIAKHQKKGCGRPVEPFIGDYQTSEISFFVIISSGFIFRENYQEIKILEVQISYRMMYLTPSLKASYKPPFPF